MSNKNALINEDGMFIKYRGRNGNFSKREAETFEKIIPQLPTKVRSVVRKDKSSFLALRDVATLMFFCLGYTKLKYGNDNLLADEEDTSERIERFYTSHSNIGSPPSPYPRPVTGTVTGRRRRTTTADPFVGWDDDTVLPQTIAPGQVILNDYVNYPSGIAGTIMNTVANAVSGAVASELTQAAQEAAQGVQNSSEQQEINRSYAALQHREAFMDYYASTGWINASSMYGQPPTVTTPQGSTDNF